MADNTQKTIVCFTTYHKGMEFMRACKKLGCKVILITVEKLRHEEWPHESLDEIFYIPEESENVNMDNVIKGIAYLMSKMKIDQIVALDDFDVERVAQVREEFRIAGMGQTRARYFRDKLAMRKQAHENKILVPPFTAVFNNEDVHAFTQKNAAPWVLKPRSSASAIGIKKIMDTNQLWNVLNSLGDERFKYVLEQFIPGDVFHVDSLIDNEKILFARAHKYMKPPMAVAHEGDVFRSHTLEYGTDEEKELIEANAKLLKAFGMKRGASHTEFIKAHADGKIYFLETSARVGGANLVEMIEASSGINLWSEWAKIELSNGEYKLPKVAKEYSGIIITLSKQTHPDMSSYNDGEIVWKMNKKQHAGLIIKAKKLDKVTSLLNQYAERFHQDFFASAPLADKPSA